MTLLFLLNRLVIGGQSLDTIPLAHYLAKKNFTVNVVYGDKQPDEEDALFLLKKFPIHNVQKIKHLKRTVNPLKDVLAFIEIYRLIKKIKPDIVHTHGAKSGLIGRLAARMAGVKVIAHTFHGHIFHSYYNSFVSLLVKKAEQFLGSISTAIVAISPFQKNELTGVYKIAPPQKIHVIPLGSDPANYIQDSEIHRASFRKQYNLSENEIAIGIIGRMVPVKNQALFVEVVALMMKNGSPNLRFFLVGDGELKPVLQRQLSQAGIVWAEQGNNPAAPVIFTSWVDDITQVLHGLDIVALTSLNEGTPLSLIEAQLCSKPIVATNVGGVRDTISEGETGLLVNSFSPEDFAEKLNLLIQSPSLRQSMGQKGRIFATQKFSRQREVEQTKQLYYDCLKQKGAL
ncbi:glycosyltransferase family 4 protein [Foetidibacter luteolus]|uniref:glycosyltransferase family 4 protein n=1 Tax=Foetidibacter luteolus TaxID=2608880 RepID=UPI00129A36D7|nr:glycosyltransferase family 4 protein [Foetidibacter luteolus]